MKAEASGNRFSSRVDNGHLIPSLPTVEKLATALAIAAPARPELHCEAPAEKAEPDFIPDSGCGNTFCLGCEPARSVAANFPHMGS